MKGPVQRVQLVNHKIINPLVLISFSFQTARIIEAPLSVTVLINTWVNFTCKGKGDILKWSVQGNELNASSNQDRKISVTTNNISLDMWLSVLFIKALPINDGISVGCNVISFDPFVFKEKGATLTIEG